MRQDRRDEAVAGGLHGRQPLRGIGDRLAVLLHGAAGGLKAVVDPRREPRGALGDQFPQDRGVEVAERVASARGGAGEGDGPAPQRIGLKHHAVEGSGQDDPAGDRFGSRRDRSARHVEEAHRHAGVHGPSEVGRRHGGESRVGEDRRQRQADRAEHVEQRLVQLPLDGRGHDAEVRLVGERGARPGDAEVEVVHVPQPVGHVGHEPRLPRVDIPAEGGVGAEVLVGLRHEPVGRRAKEFVEIRPHAQIPEVREHGQRPDKGESRSGERPGHLSEIEARPMLVEVFVGEIPHVLLE